MNVGPPGPEDPDSGTQRPEPAGGPQVTPPTHHRCVC